MIHVKMIDIDTFPVIIVVVIPALVVVDFFDLVIICYTVLVFNSITHAGLSADLASLWLADGAYLISSPIRFTELSRRRYAFI